MSGEVVTIERAEAQPPAPVQANDGAVILSMIDRLLARPDVAVEKLEQMFDLHRKVQAEAARREFLAAFADLQAELPAATRHGKGHNGKTYARFEDVMAAIRPHLHKHGFSISHRVDTSSNQICVTGILGHRAGHAEQTSMTLPPDTSGGKTAVHAMASAISYGKRYVTLTLTGIATEDDDDGQKAGSGMITPEQVIEIDALIKSAGADKAKVLEHFSIETLDDLSARQAGQVKTSLMARIRQTKGGK